MTRFRTLLAGAALALAFAGGVWAQTGLTSRSLSGTEAWQVGQGIGGASFFVTSGQMRSSQGVITTSQVTGTLSPALTNVTATLISTAAATGAMVVQLPTVPWDGEIFEWVNGAAGAFTTGNTVVTTDGSTIQGANTTGALAAATSIEFRYVLSSNIWYRVR